MAKIPKQAKKIFDGVIFDVYQWPQKLYNGQTTTFEMLKRADTVVVIAVTKNGEVLAIEHEQPMKPLHLGIPAGRVDKGEEPLTAAKRELLEETGYTGQRWEHWASFSPVSSIEWQVHYYIARDCQLTGPQELDGGERIEVLPIAGNTFLDKISSGEISAFELSLTVARAKNDKQSWENLRRYLLVGGNKAPFNTAE